MWSQLGFSCGGSLLFIFQVLLDIISVVHKELHSSIPNNVFRKRNLKAVNLNYYRNTNYITCFLTLNNVL